MTRTLKFIVDGQILKCDPECDFDNLVPGSEDYIEAEFSFSKNWYNHIKVVEFRSVMGTEYKPQLLKGGRSCMIPVEALKRRAFKIRVIGKKGVSKIRTNQITITQSGGVS